MKTSFAITAGAAALTMIFAAGCKREEPKPSAPPAPAATAPTPVPPNPPTITGVAPTPAPLKDAGPAEKAGRAIGEQIDDATLTAKVKAALLQAPDVKGTDVNVQTEKAVVQLSGFVSSQTEIERAVAIARSVKGVTEVHNKMSLKSGK